jgi:heat shock protein HslJ
MKKNILYVFVFCLLLISAYIFYVKDHSTNKSTESTSAVVALDPKNMSYTIENDVFTLVNGVAKNSSANKSAPSPTLQLFGEPVYGDLNTDGKNDAAVLLVHNPGGSGTFYYAVLILSSAASYNVTNALLLGDRIAPQTVNIIDSRAVYNYAERKANEPMTTQPSVGRSMYVHIDPNTGEIGELAHNFEGEADPNKMSLGMKKWEWVTTETNDGTVVKPRVAGKFSLTFGTDGQVSIGTDCNSMSSKYTAKDKTLVFGPIMSTKMYCEGSQEDVFARNLENIASYFFTSKGELILEIKYDSGTMTFK